MNTETKKEEITIYPESYNLEVSIGYEISQLLNLKFGKNGQTKTSWGTKSIRGLGASVLRIIEEQTARLK